MSHISLPATSKNLSSYASKELSDFHTQLTFIHKFGLGAVWLGACMGVGMNGGIRFHIEATHMCVVDKMSVGRHCQGGRLQLLLFNFHGVSEGPDLAILGRHLLLQLSCPCRQ
eukprot:184500-Pelagomonas_calceolata.AAC.1